MLQETQRLSDKFKQIKHLKVEIDKDSQITNMLVNATNSSTLNIS